MEVSERDMSRLDNDLDWRLLIYHIFCRAISGTPKAKNKYFRQR